MKPAPLRIRPVIKYFLMFFAVVLTTLLIIYNLIPKIEVKAYGSDEFVTVWNTDLGNDNKTSVGFRVAYDSGVNPLYDVDWECDGIWDETGLTAGRKIHDYGTAGIYTVCMRGTIPRFHLQEEARFAEKLIEIRQWGTNQWTSMENSFVQAINLQLTATDAPDLSRVTSMQKMFALTKQFTGHPSMANWDTSNVTNMNDMFNNATAFNQDLSNWNTTSVTSMVGMFDNATAFNNAGQPLNWNTSSVENMARMFASATSFNVPFGERWNTAKVTNMTNMFRAATIFNQDISNWDVSKVINTSAMFNNAIAFNQNLNNWNTANVVNMRGMFDHATAFNNAGQPLNWNTSSVEDMTNMFAYATSFNVPFGEKWNTAKVTNMTSMFSTTTVFNQDISNWDVSKVINTSSMFSYTEAFNQDLSNWNTASVTSMVGMFDNATAFNNAGQPLNWDTSSVEDMARMFASTTSFNVPFGEKWNTAKVTNMTSMFSTTTVFNQDISNWDVSKVIDMSRTFEATRAFDQNLSNWDTSSVKYLNYTFVSSHKFNNGGQPLNWDTSNVESMDSTFRSAYAFNAPFGEKWNTAKVTNMSYLFNGTRTFNQDVSNWNIEKVASLADAFAQTAMSPENYDKLLISWSQQNVKRSVPLGANGVYYCQAKPQRDILTSAPNNWTIADSGNHCSPSDLRISKRSVDEGTTLVGTLSSSLGPQATSVTWSFVNGEGSEDNNQFSIDTYTKRISFRQNTDFENPTDLGDTPNNNTYSIRLRAKDNLNFATDKIFIIYVRDMDEDPPEITITAPTKIKNSDIVDTTIRVADSGGIDTSNVSVSTISTLSTEDFICTQTTPTQVDCTIRITSSGNLVIRAKDSKDNIISVEESGYIIDKIKPFLTSVNINTQQDGIHKPVITFTATDNIEVKKVQIDHISNNNSSGLGSIVTIDNATSPVQLDLDPDEVSHSFTIRVIDVAGNVIEETFRFVPTITITAPTTLSNTTITNSYVTITSPMGNDIDDITIDAGTTNATLGTCTGAGGDSIAPYTSPVNCTINNITSSGTIKITARDTGTNAYNEDSESYTVDKQKPTITFNAPTKLKNSSITDTVITINDNLYINASDITVDNSTNAGYSQFLCTQENPSQVRCTISIDTSGDITINARDSVGNTENATETGYNIDKTPPIITIKTLLPINSLNQLSYSLSGTCTDGDGQVNITIGTIIANTTCNSGTFSITGLNVTTLPEGSFTVKAKQEDSAGNSTEVERNGTKDTTGPTITITEPIPNTTINDNIMNYRVSGSCEAGGRDVNIKMTDEGTTVIQFTTQCSTTGLYTYTIPTNQLVTLNEGQVTLTISQEDIYGNSSSRQITLTMNEADSTAPIATMNNLVTKNPSPKLTGTVDDISANVTLKIKGITHNAVVKPDMTWELDLNALNIVLEDGKYTIELSASDALTNSNTYTFDNVLSIDTNSPTLNFLQLHIQPVKGKPFTMPEVTCTDPVVNGYASGCTAIQSEGTIDTDKPLDTVYNITYTVLDNVGNTTTRVRTFTLTSGTSPQIQIVGDEVVVVDVNNPEGYVDQGVNVIDLEDGDITDGVVVTIQNEQGDVLSSISTQYPAVYTVIYTVTDESGNVTIARRTVKVVVPTKKDILPPNTGHEISSKLRVEYLLLLFLILPIALFGKLRVRKVS